MQKDRPDREPTPAEAYAEDYWKKHGFQYGVIRRYVSKTVYLVTKDAMEMHIEIPGAVTDPVQYLELFQRTYEMEKKFRRSILPKQA